MLLDKPLSTLKSLADCPDAWVKQHNKTTIMQTHDLTKDAGLMSVNNAL